MLRPRDFEEKIRKEFISVISLFFLLWTAWYNSVLKGICRSQIREIVWENKIHRPEHLFCYCLAEALGWNFCFYVPAINVYKKVYG